MELLQRNMRKQEKNLSPTLMMLRNGIFQLSQVEKQTGAVQSNIINVEQNSSSVDMHCG